MNSSPTSDAASTPWSLNIVATWTEHASIIAVQRLLKEERLYFGDVTGELDAATSAAIQQYGMANGLLYSELVDSLRTAASDSEYKTRWVDQTPE